MIYTDKKMTELNCNFCEQNFKSEHKLLSHLKKCKSSIKDAVEEKNTKNSNFCEFCEKNFSSKFNLKRHLDSCSNYQAYKINNSLIAEQKEKILSLRTEVTIYKTKYEDLKVQYDKLLEHFSTQKNVTTTNTTTNNTHNYHTNNTNNMTVKQYVSQLQPITQKDFENSIQFYNEKYIDEGAIGYAKYLLEHPCNNKIITTDLSRKVVAYRTEKNEFIKDPKCRELIKMAIGDNKNDIIDICTDRRKKLANDQRIDDDPVMYEIYSKKLNDITEFVIFLKNDLDDYDYTNVPGKISSQITNSTPQYNNVKNVLELE